MSLVAILTAVALALTHKHVPVYGNAPPHRPWVGQQCGWTYYPPPRIFLRYPNRTVRLEWAPLVCFSHELLHVEHPDWPHWKVYAYQAWYAPVVRRAIVRVKKNGPTPFQVWGRFLRFRPGQPAP